MTLKNGYETWAELSKISQNIKTNMPNLMLGSDTDTSYEMFKATIT